MKKKLLSMLIALSAATTGMMGTSAVFAADAQRDMFSDSADPFTDGMNEASDFAEFEPTDESETEDSLIGEEILSDAEEESILFEEAEPEEVLDAASAQQLSGASNTSIVTAEAIEVNTTYSDNLEESCSSNWYKFTLSEDGYISLEFASPYINSGRGDWAIILLNKSEEQILREERGVTDPAYKSMNIGLAAGTYYIKIGKLYNLSTETYNFRVNFNSSDVWETELNDNSSSADLIRVNETRQGTIKTYKDADWYQFEVPKKGYISLTFEHKYLETRTEWHAALYNEKREIIAETSSGREDTSKRTGNVGLNPGKYYLEISSDNNYTSDTDYSFKINYHTSDVWETEFNENFDTANAIKVNELKYGSTHNAYDNDWFKFSIPKAGYINLTFKHKKVNSTNYYGYVTFYHSDLQELASYDIRLIDSTTNTWHLGVPAGTYFVKIHTNDPVIYYSFKINYSASDVWETEFNDVYREADSLKENMTKNASLRKYGDVDWFKFKQSRRGSVNLNFGHEYEDSSYTYWYVDLYNKNMKEVKSIRIDNRKKMQVESLGTLSAGTYYLKVYNSGWYYDTSDYTISVSNHKHSYKTYTTKATLTKNGKTYKKCSCGDVLSSSIIYHPEEITLEATTMTYNGKVRTPSVKVVASNGKTISASNYDLVYSKGRKNPGKYAVVIKFKGKYSGSVKKYFTIVKK